MRPVGDHFYTTSAAERDNAVANLGYINEGIACDVLGAAGAGTTPLFRVFSPASGDHFYTTDVAERDNAVANLGYVDESIACDVFPAAGAGTTPLFRAFSLTFRTSLRRYRSPRPRASAARTAAAFGGLELGEE